MTENKEILSLLHDINSPICALRGLLHSSERNEKLEKLAYNKILKISKKLQAFFGEDASTEQVHLLDSIENIISLKEAEHPKIVFSVSIPNEHRSLTYSFSQLDFERMLSNIINNSVEAGATQVMLKLSRKDNNYNLKVIDNGQGFHAYDLMEMKKKKVYTTKKHGSGLGISTGVSFMEKLQGNLRIFSTPFVGSSLILTFPIDLFRPYDFGPMLA